MIIEARAVVGARQRARLRLTPALAATTTGLISSVLYAWLMTIGLPMDLDGQAVIAERIPASSADVLMPYHQHFVALPVLLWDQLALVFGTVNPGPYFLLLFACHLALATATTYLLARRLSPAYGLAIGLPLAVLGGSHYNLVSPWQITFTIPLLCGLIAVAASTDRERTWALRLIVVVSLVIAVLASNVAEFVIAGMGAWFILDRRPRQAWELVPAIVLFTAWFMSFGRTGLWTDSQPDLLAIVPFTMTGLASTASLGLSTLAGYVVLAGLATAAFRRGIPAPLVAFAVAAASVFVVGAVFRAYGDAARAETSRYVLIGVYLVVFGVIGAGSRPPLAERWALAIGASLALIGVLELWFALPVYLAGGFG